MVKLLILLTGLAVGGAGTAGWLLSAPGPVAPDPLIADANSPQGRIEVAKARFRNVQAEGKRSQEETLRRLEQKLDTYRAGK